MLIKAEARNTAGSVLFLTLSEVATGFIVEEIEGLDPVKATLVSSSFAQLDGAQYQSARRETRNIVLTIGLEPDYATHSVRDLRSNLYAFFMPKSQVGLRFFTADGLIVDITGRVESFETPFFTKEPQVTISVICFDPDFTELTPVVVSHDTVADSTEFTINYPGTVDTGIEFVLNVDRDISEFTIYHRPPDGVLRSLDFQADLEADDVLTINTVVGAKKVTLLRGGTLSSVLYGMSPQSSWIELAPGENHLRVYAIGDPIPFTITYTTRHGGL